MELVILPNGIIDTNTYIVIEGQECAIIDCGVKARDVIKVLEQRQLRAKYILLTHGHFDHVYHVQEYKDATGALVCLHESEVALYHNPEMNGFVFFGLRRDIQLPQPDVLLKDNQQLELGSMTLEIIHTPGHSPGGICIKAENKLFTGDTLFAMSIGRTDLYGGSAKALNQTIAQKLFSLPEDTVVYPGHGPQSSIGYEKANNPYV